MQVSAGETADTAAAAFLAPGSALPADWALVVGTRHYVCHRLAQVFDDLLEYLFHRSEAKCFCTNAHTHAQDIHLLSNIQQPYSIL